MASRFAAVTSEEIIQINFCTIHLRTGEEKQNGFCRYMLTNKVTLWAASYSACVVYTKTIIHLSVSESGDNLLLYFWEIK